MFSRKTQQDQSEDVVALVTETKIKYSFANLVDMYSHKVR